MYRRLYITSLLILLSFPVWSDNEPRQKGYIVVFNFDASETQGDIEISHDHIYSYSNIRPWLGRNNIGHTYKETSNFAVILASGKKIDFDKNTLIYTVGTVIIRSDGKYKINKRGLYGR